MAVFVLCRLSDEESWVVVVEVSDPFGSFKSTVFSIEYTNSCVYRLLYLLLRHHKELLSLFHRYSLLL